MLLLGLDTATPAVTVALHDGGQPLAQLVTVDAHRHAELLAPAIAKVLEIPVYGLCTLDVIAADVDAGGGEFLVATDARRRELYWASYDGSGRRTAGPEVAKPALIPVSGRPAAGEGPMLYPELLPDGLGPAFPAAATLCRIAVTALAAGDPDKRLLPPEPLYLRRPDVREPGAPKRVTP